MNARNSQIPSFAALALLALCAGEPALARTSEPPTMPTAEPAPRRATDPASATPDDLSIRKEEEEGSCCNGMGGPVEEEPVVVVGHFADPAGEWRRWVAPIDANLERRYAPRPAPSLNPITLPF
jgi:hypothetical protein